MASMKNLVFDEPTGVMALMVEDLNLITEILRDIVFKLPYLEQEFIREFTQFFGTGLLRPVHLMKLLQLIQDHAIPITFSRYADLLVYVEKTTTQVLKYYTKEMMLILSFLKFYNHDKTQIEDWKNSNPSPKPASLLLSIFSSSQSAEEKESLQEFELNLILINEMSHTAQEEKNDFTKNKILDAIMFLVMLDKNKKQNDIVSKDTIRKIVNFDDEIGILMKTAKMAEEMEIRRKSLKI